MTKRLGSNSKELKQEESKRKVISSSFRVIPLKKCIEFSKDYYSEVDYVRVYLSLLKHLQRIPGGVSK